MSPELHSRVVSWLASALVVTACLEFVALRVLLRSGPTLERGRVSEALADTILLVGLTALTAGVLFAAGLIGVLSWKNLSTDSWTLIVAGASGTMLAAVLVLAASPVRPSSSLLLPAMLLSSMVAAGALTVPTRTISSRAFLSLICGVLLWTGVYFAGQANKIGFSHSAGISALHVAEMFILISSVAALFLLRRKPSRVAVVTGITASAFLYAWLAAIPWLPGTMAIWNFGLSMFLPGPVYVIILGLFTMAIIQLFRDDPRIATAYLLIVLGGLKWDVPYFNLLGIAGLLLLVDSLRVPETPIT
jgi:hypothetical protein